MAMVDDALTREALASTPVDAVSDDATPWLPGTDLPGDGVAPTLLPAWYMPAPAAVSVRGWRRMVAFVIIASFLAITAAGLCNTYGELSFV